MLSPGHNAESHDVIREYVCRADDTRDRGCRDDSCRDEFHAVLARLSERTCGIWCLIDKSSQTICLCSRAFRQFWGLPVDNSQRLSAARVDVDISRAQLSPVWAKWLPPLPQLIAQAMELPLRDGHNDAIGTMVRCEEVAAFGAQPGGRLLAIEPAGVFCITPDHRDLISRVNSRLPLLSDREAEVLDLVCDGLTNAAIAGRLGISHKTVEKHRSSIMTKLQVRSVPELVRGITLAQLAVG